MSVDTYLSLKRAIIFRAPSHPRSSSERYPTQKTIYQAQDGPKPRVNSPSSGEASVHRPPSARTVTAIRLHKRRRLPGSIRGVGSCMEARGLCESYRTPRLRSASRIASHRHKLDELIEGPNEPVPPRCQILVSADAIRRILITLMPGRTADFRRKCPWPSVLPLGDSMQGWIWTFARPYRPCVP